MFVSRVQDTYRRFGSRIKWRIVHKLTVASVLMVILVMLTGGVGLWQVITIGQTINDAREKQTQLVHSLELRAAGHGLVAAMDHMLVVQESLLASTEVIPSLGILQFHMETLREAGSGTGSSGILDEIQVVYDELLGVANEVNSLARQERWTEVGAILEQEIRPGNKRLGQLIEGLVRQADRDVEAITVHTQVVVRQALLLQAVLMVLTITIALGWRQFVFRGLSLSISELRQGVARISSGDLDHKLDIRTGDEIEELGDEFNKMADELADVVDNLKQRNEHLQSRVQEYVAHIVEVAEGNLSARLTLDENDREQDAPLVALGRNLNEMTDSLQRMIDRERSQREVIEEQQRAIQKLSSPIIPVMDTPQGNIIVMPLIGVVDSMRARGITRGLLAGIRDYQAKVVILDITGVPVVDSGVADYLNKTIQAARLKGARVIITGISDAVAETIVDLGIDWSNIETVRDLQMGLVVALNRLGIKLVG